MAGLAGFGAGLLEGYGTVSRIQDRKRARDLQERRIENNEAYRDRRLGLQQTQIEQDQKNADRRFGLAQDKFGFQKSQGKAENARANAQLGIARDKADANIRATDALTQNRKAATRVHEIEAANAARKEREKQNRRALKAAVQELDANGPTQRFRDLSQRGSMDVDNFLDPDWQDSLNILKTGLQGGPISRKAMVDAANTFYNDRIERMVGQKTPDGKTIVRSRLADFYPGPNGETAVMDLDVWTRDKNGNVEKYRAPATSNRRTDDEYVREVPIPQLTGNIAATDMALKFTDKKRLKDTIRQTAILNGATDPADASGTEWARGPGNTLFNRQTGETRQVQAVSDEKERYGKAFDMARDDLQKAQKNGLYNEDGSSYTPDQIQQWLLKRRNMYLRMMTPGSEGGDGDDRVVISGSSQYGDVTEADIQATMQANGLTRAQVMERLNGG